mmetsp:Transcript_119747/g.187827  ORF Transcript_119747/g.187827 Transcript_119747/m.187827 type:complete len:89 (+) Transcript_119747:2-268(+)
MSVIVYLFELDPSYSLCVSTVICDGPICGGFEDAFTCFSVERTTFEAAYACLYPRSYLLCGAGIRKLAPKYQDFIVFHRSYMSSIVIF